MGPPTPIDGYAHTLAETAAPVRGSRPSLPNYREAELLGRGGMGEVVLAHDDRLDRAVAIKRMRSEATPELAARFLREARIQARLDHPSVVPVHETGVDADGVPYFTMKRLTGRTLASLIPEAAMQRLLRALVDVCLAVELAHARGVIHRDLKPANVMLGDYGEVYVLDWGIATIAGEPDPELDFAGTPGYMAPEQARGEPLTPAADSYALGCILREILRDEPPPELGALRDEALAETAAARPDARTIADRIQCYLDGDRDLERRRDLAVVELARAHAALAEHDRATAMQAAGRAMALDPRSAAAELVSQLMLAPPDPLPPELADHLAAVDDACARTQLRKVALVYAAPFGFLPVLAWNGVHEPWLVLAIFVLLAGLLASAAWWSRTGRPRLVPWLLTGAVVMVLATRVFGDLVVVPGMIGVQIVGYLAYPGLIRRPLYPLALVVATLLAPLALGPDWELTGDAIVVHAPAIELTPGLIVAANLTVLVVLGLFAWALACARREAQRALEIQAWHLRNLIPRQAC
ncbi:MAG: protein kinase [Kofleriaceae bacterium]